MDKAWAAAPSGAGLVAAVVEASAEADWVVAVWVAVELAGVVWAEAPVAASSGVVDLAVEVAGWVAAVPAGLVAVVPGAASQEPAATKTPLAKETPTQARALA